MDALEATLLGVGIAGVLAASAWLSVIDVREHRLPNAVVGPLAGAVVVWLVALGAVTGDLSRTAAALGWGSAGFGVFLILNLSAGVGMGDVKYAWPATATLGWFGWGAIQVALWVLILTGGLAGGVVIARGASRDTPIAYGPYMALGLACGIISALV